MGYDLRAFNCSAVPTGAVGDDVYFSAEVGGLGIFRGPRSLYCMLI